MFIRKKKNKSGTVSVQIIDKSQKYKVVHSVGNSRDPDEIERLVLKGKSWIDDSNKKINQLKLFPFKSNKELIIEEFLDNLSNSQVRTIGPELIIGTIFDNIGFDLIKEKLFRYLVISRLVFPTSKLGTVDYLRRYQGIDISVDQIYRFLDELKNNYQEEVEQVAYQHSQRLLGKNIGMMFYDMTTLYFEAESEDDLRKTGFSKDGKFNQPQIMLGLLVGINGYPIGYDVFEGSTYEGHTLIPIIEKFAQKYSIPKPIIIADSGLLSKKNIIDLEEQNYHYILGARIKNETKKIKTQILEEKEKSWDKLLKGKTINIAKDKAKLIISYSDKRAKKDKHNREKGLKRLEKKVKNGQLTKKHINNRGYNKYLTLIGEINITIDYRKFKQDEQWDGLKGYVSNSNLSDKTIIDSYSQLWQIERAFRISKTDLRIRPIYHQIKSRIQAHICIAFVAYTIYKELERILKEKETNVSVKKAIELTKTMYVLEHEIMGQNYSTILKMDEQQQLVFEAINS